MINLMIKRNKNQKMKFNKIIIIKKIKQKNLIFQFRENQAISQESKNFTINRLLIKFNCNK